MPSIPKENPCTQEYNPSMSSASHNPSQSSKKGENDRVNALSHELRTPLAIISGYAEMLEEETGSEHAHLTRPIRDAVERLLHVVDSVVAYEQTRQPARVHSIAPRVEGTRIPLNHLVGRTIEKVQRRHPESSAQIMRQLDHGISLPTDLADVLSESLNHVLDNAVKYADESIRIIASIEEGALTLSVQDDGPGLPGKSVAVFAPFQQGSTGLNREKGGLGMGLFLAKRSLNQVSGSIQLSELEGRTGTRATIRIPMPTQGVLRRAA